MKATTKQLEERIQSLIDFKEPKRKLPTWVQILIGWVIGMSILEIGYLIFND